MITKGNHPDQSSIEDMIADFDHDELDLDRDLPRKAPRHTTRNMLLSAVAVVAVVAVIGHVAQADTNVPAPATAQPLAMTVSEVDALITAPIDPLAQLEEEFVGHALSHVEPTSGEPSPQVLGGSDESVIAAPPEMPMPTPVEQAVSAPSEELAPPPETQAIVAEPIVVPAPAPEPAPELSSVAEAPATLPTPDTAVLANPAPAPAPAGPGVMETVSGSSATTKLTPEPKSDAPDNYYSSQSVPSGPMANSIGPRKVDPVMEPASKLVISKKTVEAGDLEAQVAAASRALELERYDAALEMYDQLYKRNQRDTRILMGRAVAQQKLGQDDVAILSYEELLNLVPNNTDAVVNMMGLIKKQYPAVALRRLSDLRDKFPGNAGIAAQLGMTYAEMGENQRAMQALGTAASLDPNNAQHVFNMAVVADRAGSKDMAVKYYEQALQTDAVYGGGKSIPRETIYDRLSKLRY
jgi:Flp pilus assembly protein TadD